jgi:hypothetical protein
MNDIRALIAVGIKLEMPGLSMDTVVEYTNALCNKQKYNIYHRDLTCSDLRVLMAVSLRGTTWEDLEKESTMPVRIEWCRRVHSLESILSEAVNDLVYEAECRMLQNIPLDEDFDLAGSQRPIPLTQEEFDTVMKIFETS